MSSFSYIDNANNEVPDASQYRFGIVVTEWNNHITDTLLEGAVQTLKQYGVAESSITIERVPGSFELIYACSQLAKRGYLDAEKAHSRALFPAARRTAKYSTGERKTCAPFAKNSHCAPHRKNRLTAKAPWIFLLFFAPLYHAYLSLSSERG